jgi:protein TonB
MKKSFENWRNRSGLYRIRRLLLTVFVGGGLSACVSQGSDNRPLQLLSGSAPVYPSELQERGIQGQVTVQYDVTAQGLVTNARVIRSDPVGVFDDAALQAVTSWTFRPQIRDGQAQEVRDIASNLMFQKL